MSTRVLLGLASALAFVVYALGVFDPDVEDPPVGGLGETHEGADGGTLEGRGTEDAQAPRPEPPTPVIGPRTEIRSQGPGRIVGHVLSEATGRGLPGVRITLRVPSSRVVAGAEVPGAHASVGNTYWSDADGAFLCDGLPLEHTYTLVFQEAEHAYAQRGGIAFAPASPVVDVGAVLLPAGLTLSGRVVDEAGAAVPGVELTVGDPRQRPMPVGFDFSPTPLRGAVALTDAEGRFALPNLAQGYHRLVARKAAYATAALGEVQVTPGRAPLRITLRAADVLAVVVVDPSGAPVPEAVVWVNLDESVRAGRQGFSRRFLWAEKRTDASGRAEVDDLPIGRGVGVVLEVEHPQFTAFYEAFSAQPASPYRVTLQPIIETRGFPVRVRLRSAAGEAIAGASGYLQVSGTGVAGDFSRKVDVAAEGATPLEGIPAGEHYVYALVAGYRAGSETILVEDGPLDVELTLERGAVARGVVVDAVTAEPLPGATIRQNDVNAVTSDVRGRFALWGLSGGRHRFGALQVDAPGYLDASPSLPFAEGADEVDIRVALQPVSALKTVQGVVRDPAGSPVAGALLGLELSGSQTYTVRARSGVDGRFAFRGVRPDHLTDNLRIRVLHARYAPADIPLARAEIEQPLEIRLGAGRRVRGRVVDQAGTPVAGASVGAISTDRWWKIEGERIGGNSMDSWTYRILPYLAGSATTDGAGRFVLAHMPEDALQVLAFGRMTTWLVANGKTGAYLARGTRDVDEIVIRVRRGWALRGRVVDAAGLPVPAVRVAAEGVLVSDFTRRDGGFDLSPVFRGDTTVRVKSDDYAAEVQVVQGHGAQLEIEVTPRGIVSGYVSDGRGQPVSGAVVALGEAQDGPRDTTSEDGGFALHGLPIGAVELVVSHEGRTARVPVTVRHKQANDVGRIELR